MFRNLPTEPLRTKRCGDYICLIQFPCFRTTDNHDKARILPTTALPFATCKLPPMLKSTSIAIEDFKFCGNLSIEDNFNNTFQKIYFSNTIVSYTMTYFKHKDTAR